MVAEIKTLKNLPLKIGQNLNYDNFEKICVQVSAFKNVKKYRSVYFPNMKNN